MEDGVAVISAVGGGVTGALVGTGEVVGTGVGDWLGFIVGTALISTDGIDVAGCFVGTDGVGGEDNSLHTNCDLGSAKQPVVAVL